MHRRQPVSMAALAATLLLGPLAPGQPSACSLLTEAQVSTALEVQALPGKPPVPSAQKLCIWSDDPRNGINSRRVTLALMTTMAFELGKSNKQLKIESVSGIGDEAYYEVFSADSPLLVVRKGSSAFNVRILNGLKFKSFTIDQVKAKEADLAKAVAAKL